MSDEVQTYRRADLRDHEIVVTEDRQVTGKDLAKAIFRYTDAMSVEIHPRTPARGEVTVKITADAGLRGYARVA